MSTPASIATQDLEISNSDQLENDQVRRANVVKANVFRSSVSEQTRFIADDTGAARHIIHSLEMLQLRWATYDETHPYPLQLMEAGGMYLQVIAMGDVNDIITNAYVVLDCIGNLSYRFLN